jgi:2,4-dienoyl-CoA reductase-like NADH-dependent reductase (Old Yellow Enzyme family)/thioredoxin reductase
MGSVMAANAHYPHVFEPLRVGHVEVPNRLFFTPHGAGYVAPDPSAPGFWGPAPNTLDYYVERARGGIGLIIQGGTIVHPSSEYPALWQLFSERSAELWRPVVEGVQAHGTKMFVQLMHAGNHGDHNGLYGGPLSSSALPPVEGAMLGMPFTPLLVPVKAMTPDDIAMVVAAFEQCAVNARIAGYDGVELHASHSYLAEQFYSPFYNKRTDDYGGTLENRLRFTYEVLEALRRGIGDDRAVGLRLNCDEMLPGGLASDEMCEIATRIDERGLADFFDLDIGTYHSMEVMIAPYQLPDHWEMDAISEVRGAISRATVFGCPGRFHDPAKAEAIIAAGTLDMVGGTRGFFAEPEIGRKAREGRAPDIRPCIGLAGCTGGGGCVVNSTNGEESTFGAGNLVPTTSPRQVVVVGAGPGGLEAARVAASRGHDVVVLEAANEVGGALHLMKAIPGREQVTDAADWWSRQLDDLGVKVQVNTRANVDIVLGEAPDVVVVATGAVFDRSGVTGFATDPIPGWDRPFVYTPEAVLGEGLSPAGITVVLEEEPQGAVVAEVLATRGADVELVSRALMVAQQLNTGGQRPLEIARLQRLGVRMTSSTWIREIYDGRVTLRDIYSGAERTITDVAAVVLVTARTSRNELATALHGRVADIRVIGDAAHPRRMSDATREGHRLAWNL